MQKCEGKHLVPRSATALRNESQDVLGIVPRMMIPPGVILQERVVSDIDGLAAPDALILTGAEKDVDYSPLNLVEARGGEISLAGATAVATAAREAEKRGVIHRRDWPEVDEQGFRRLAGGRGGVMWGAWVRCRRSCLLRLSIH